MEGLFRVPGNSTRQQILREALNSGAEIDLDSGEFHSNDVATVLKTFLGELPEPLLTHKHFHAHLKISGEPELGVKQLGVSLFVQWWTKNGTKDTFNVHGQECLRMKPGALG